MNEIEMVSQASQSMGWGAIGGITFITLLVVSVVITVVLSKIFRKVVDPNEVHVVQSGRKTTVYGNIVTNDGEEVIETEGNTYFDWPDWWPIVGVQSRVLPLSVFDQDLSTCR